MSQIRGVSITAIVNEIDEGVLDAVRVLKAAIKDEKAKTSERTTAANSLLKIKTQMFGMQRQQVYDRIDLKMKQINLRTAELKLLALEGVADPKSTPEQVKTALTKSGLNNPNNFDQGDNSQANKALQIYAETRNQLAKTQLENMISRVDYYA